MNIDSSSLLSLFSSTESLEGLQQTLQLDSEVPQEFANILMQKITQLKNLELDENFTLNLSDGENTLHELADLLNENGVVADFSNFFGKSLPTASKLDGEIDLENTLQALENVMNTLEELVVEEESLKQGLVDETGLDEALDHLFSSPWSNNETLPQKTKDLVTEKEEIIVDQLQVEAQLEKADEQKDELLIASQMAAIVATLDESKEIETKTLLVGGQAPETGNKKDPLLYTKAVEERILSVSDKEDENTLLQKENTFRKPGLDNPIIVAKQNEKTEMPDATDIDLTKGKVIPKFATDIANLNRAVMHENKAEIPPMTKHFAHPEWNKEIGERVIWMHKQEIPSAELRLNPRHLGPVTIKIDMTQEQASISFIAQHAAVKDAIEAAIPRLREMFSAQQLNLADVNVTQDDSSQKHSRGFDQMGNGSGKGGNNAGEMPENEVHDHAMDIVEEIEAGRAIASNGILSIFA
jgi:flagellar hook-length control protein FliK